MALDQLTNDEALELLLAGHAQGESEVAFVVDDDVIAWELEGLDFDTFEQLLLEHRPAREQRRWYERRNPRSMPLLWDMTTFPPALLSACSVKPTLPIDQAKRLCLSDADWLPVFRAALTANGVDLGTVSAS